MLPGCGSRDKEKYSGADCMQSAPLCFRHKPIFLDKMKREYTSNQDVRLDEGIFSDDAVLETEIINNRAFQNLHNPIFALKTINSPAAGRLLFVKVKLVAKMLEAIHAQESKRATREKVKTAVEELRFMKLKEAAKKLRTVLRKR